MRWIDPLFKNSNYQVILLFFYSIALERLWTPLGRLVNSELRKTEDQSNYRFYAYLIYILYICKGFFFLLQAFFPYFFDWTIFGSPLYVYDDFLIARAKLLDVPEIALRIMWLFFAWYPRSEPVAAWWYSKERKVHPTHKEDKF